MGTEADLAPLTMQRVLDILDDMGAAYTVDDDGDILSLWDGNAFYIYTLADGSVLQVLGSWGRVVSNSEFDKLLLGANEIHSTQLYPRICIEPGDAGMLSVSTRHPGDFRHGATDAQLGLHISLGISTAVAYFEHLNSLYPDARPASYNLGSAG